MEGHHVKTTSPSSACGRRDNVCAERGRQRERTRTAPHTLISTHEKARRAVARCSMSVEARSHGLPLEAPEGVVGWPNGVASGKRFQFIL